jgi:hypothetical protein
MARLGQILRRLLIPAEVVVASEEVRRRGSFQGTTIHEATSHEQSWPNPECIECAPRADEQTRLGRDSAKPP